MASLKEQAGGPEPLFKDVLAAAGRLAGKAHRTPLFHSRRLDRRVEGRLFLKMESFQKSGAFKFRGAFNALAALPEEVRQRGVITASSGNHGGALALAAQMLKVPATVVMPEDYSQVKRAAIEDTGARVVLAGLGSDERLSRAQELAAREGLVMIPPYDHPAVIAGQGTVALEVMGELSAFDLYLAPCGGGGLLAGSSLALHARRPEVEILGVEPETANDTALSLEAGHLVTTPVGQTMADGARNVCPGVLTFPIVQRLTQGIVLVDDDVLKEAVRFLFTRLKVVVEPTGALAVAALMQGTPSLAGRTAVAVVSGGNLDGALLARCLAC